MTKRGWAAWAKDRDRGAPRRSSEEKRRRKRLLVWGGIGGVALLMGLCVFLATRTSSSHAASSWQPPSLADVEARLHADTFDDFVESSTELYVLRFPQVVTQLGLADELGVRNDRLNDYSEAYERETAAIERYFLSRLRSFNRDALAPAQRAAYDTCEWMWTRSEARRALQFSGYAADSTAASWEGRLVRFFAVDLPLRNQQDIADYLACLYQATAQVEEIERWVAAEEERGIVPPDGVISRELVLLGGLRATHTTSANDLGLFRKVNGAYHPFFVRFRESLAGVPGLTREEQTKLLTETVGIVEERIIPAFERLYSKVARKLAETPEDEVGIGPRLGAEASYAELLEIYSGTRLRPEEVHQLAQADVERLRPEIERLSGALGLRSGTAIAALLAYVSEPEETPDGPIGPPDITAPRDGFDLTRAAPRVLPFGVGADDGDREPWGLGAPDPFYGFIEGSKLYLARLAWEDEPTLLESPRLALAAALAEYEAAVAAVVDTGIHVLGWGLRAATAYYRDTIYQDAGVVPVDARYAVSGLAAAPARAAGRYAACCRILALRTAAQEAAGRSFSLRDFHERLLAHGARPLETVDTLALVGAQK